MFVWLLNRPLLKLFLIVLLVIQVLVRNNWPLNLSKFQGDRKLFGSKKSLNFIGAWYEYNVAFLLLRSTYFIPLYGMLILM